LLNSADALLLPLKDFGRPYLGLSTKLYEYQAIGKPIICCANGIPAEYIQKTHSGIVVKPGHFEEICNSIIYLKKNKDVAKEMGENGRRYVENNVFLEKIGFNMKILFEKLLNRNQE